MLLGTARRRKHNILVELTPAAAESGHTGFQGKGDMRHSAAQLTRAVVFPWRGQLGWRRLPAVISRTRSEATDAAARLLGRCALGEIAEISGFIDEEYDKTYDTCHVVTKAGDHFVLKLADEVPEVRVCREILVESDPTPRMIAAEPADAGRSWLLLEHVGCRDIREDDLRCH